MMGYDGRLTAWINADTLVRSCSDGYGGHSISIHLPKSDKRIDLDIIAAVKLQTAIQEWFRTLSD